ncbi:MAG: cytochrome c biogenesis protein CcsA [Prevotellaceae bacterium]|nr:cytochrome c biogenesis protein CcsA [Prevotellaceae bacterium]
MLYNNRICPLNTAATDFVQKLSGKATWQGLSADEIFVGWMIYYDYWEQQPIIRIKNEEVQQIIGINGSWASLRNFYSISNEYKLQKYLNDASLSISTRKAIREADEKVRIISMFYAGEFIKIFPLNNHWYSPGSTQLPKNTPTKEFQFIKRVMDQVVQATLVNDTQTASTLIVKIRNYQREHAPIPSTLGVEVLYNKILTQRWPIMLFLTASLILCIVTIMRKNSRNMHKALLTLQILLFAYTTTSIILRWIISGHIPLSNGFETMQFMAWAIITITLLMRRRTPLLNPLGPVVSSFALLVSMIACGSPQLTPLMPVLQSPFMSIHVMMVMLAYSLFAILALLSIQALVTKQGAETVTSLSKQLLYPSVALLAIGIFIGAVWANVSWGRYWGWDPKETWALITLMIYAIPLHKTLFPYSDRTYHWYILVSFLAVLMTYFGVNYLLPGMHSYA